MQYSLSTIVLGSREVTSLVATSPDNATLVISWGPPTNSNGDTLSYFVSIINLKDGSTVRMENMSTMANITATGLGRRQL